MKVKLEKGAFALTRPKDTVNVFQIKSMDSSYIPAHGTRAFDTGIHVELSNDTVGLVSPYHPLNIKHKIVSYEFMFSGTQEGIIIRLYNHSDVPYWIEAGSILALLTVIPVKPYEFLEYV